MDFFHSDFISLDPNKVLEAALHSLQLQYVITFDFLFRRRNFSPRVGWCHCLLANCQSEGKLLGLKLNSLPKSKKSYQTSYFELKANARELRESHWKLV